jgi:hypothetical protein
MSDIRDAQVILRKALGDAAQALREREASILLPLLMEQFSVYVVEYMGYGESLREPGGVDKIVRASLDPLEKMLREGIAGYLDHEKKQPRH